MERLKRRKTAPSYLSTDWRSAIEL